MNNSLFYNHIEENLLNKDIICKIEEYASTNPEKQLYLLTSPLGEKYKYDYAENAIVILSPKHKIIFLDLKGDGSAFDSYFDDFIEDLNSLSDKFKYKDSIGRPRDWKQELTVKEEFNQQLNLDSLFKRNELLKPLERKCELLISLLIGSINDIGKVGVEEPSTLLEKVKKNIILFDGEQTRFIYKEFQNKTVSIQGLSGTGKTELLLHKLKELYIADETSKIFFTCHNIALANTLKERVPAFFNFMKVEKQIEWYSRLWVNRAWGSLKDKNSGLYSYLCNFYHCSFQRYDPATDYNKIFTLLLNHVSQINEDDFEFAFDFIFIDERQDFPKVFFDLCEKVTKKKVYIAGDIFQDIFENTNETELEVDVILNRCYRTDPRTLMFAHAIGLGLFENKKLNWFEDSYWEAIGYKLTRHNHNEVHLSREPIRRFENLELEDIKSVIIQNSTEIKNVIDIIKEIQLANTSVTADDIAIIMVDDSNAIYSFIDSLSYEISKQLGWQINRAIESKAKEPNTLYITNPNNVKGLEFPFVICIAGALKNNYRFRNTLYTMLTRSFIQSHLLVYKSHGIDLLEKGLETINNEKYINTVEPTEKEKEEIKNKIVELKQTPNISFKDFLNKLFNEEKVKYEFRNKLEKALLQTDIERFDLESTLKFIQANKEFYN